MKKIKKDADLYFDYRDTKTLQRYIDIYGRIEPIAKTGLSAKQQRRLAVAICGKGLRCTVPPILRKTS